MPGRTTPYSKFLQQNGMTAPYLWDAHASKQVIQGSGEVGATNNTCKAKIYLIQFDSIKVWLHYRLKICVFTPFFTSHTSTRNSIVISVFYLIFHLTIFMVTNQVGKYQLCQYLCLFANDSNRNSHYSRSTTKHTQRDC